MTHLNQLIMISKERKTSFNMTYAELAVLGHQICDTVTRDITEFEKFGITNSKVTAFQSQVTALDNTPRDEEFQALVMEATNVKNQLADQTKTLIRKALVFIKDVYPVNSAIFKALDTARLAKKSNNELNRIIYGIVRISRLQEENFLPELQVVVNELETVNNQLLEKLKAQHSAIQDRDIATLERIKLANSLYSQLSSFNYVGQTIWAEVHEAKYNDYVISGSSKKKSSSPPENSEQEDDELPNG